FVDANATPAAASTAAQVLQPSGSVLTLQNGIGNVEALSAVLGAARVVGGITLNSANLPAAGHADHSHEGPSWIGELDGRRSPGWRRWLHSWPRPASRRSSPTTSRPRSGTSSC